MAKYKDYKFWYIRRDDDGFITEAAIRFYEGEYRQVIHPITEKKTIQYVRIKRLEKDKLKVLKGKVGRDREEIRIFTPIDFSQIKTDDELRKFLNKELNKIVGLKAIPEQKI